MARARSFVHVEGTIWVYVNHEEFTYYVNATAGHSGAAMRQVIAQMRAWGLEPVDDEDPTPVGDNAVRMHYSPISPLSDEEIDWLAREEVIS